MARSKWTPAELDALERVATEQGMAAYHAWGALTGYTKSFDAFEVKRRRVTQGTAPVPSALDLGTPVPAEPELITAVQMAGYVGFNVAYWDLETTFSTQPIVLYGALADQFGRVEEFRKGPDITDDRDLVERIARRLEAFDIWVTWNGKLFDVPVLNGRLLFHGLPPLEKRMHLDLMYKATGSSVRIGRRSLQSVSEYFGTAHQKTPLLPRIWDAAMAGSEEAYEKIAEHGSADVLVLRDNFQHLKPQVVTVSR